MNTSPIATLVRAWVDLYTRGLPDDTRAARRDEVEDDVWCQHEEAFAVGRPAWSLNLEMLLRLLFGMPADVGWRLSTGAAGGPAIERHPSAGDRALGVLAIVGAVSWLLLIGAYAFAGPGVWSGPGGLVIFAFTVLGGLAFTGAAIGLALRLQDRISVVGALGGVFAGVGALFGALGGYQADILLPIGSGILALDLGRAGILARGCALAHAASAVPAFMLLMASVTNYERLVAIPWAFILIVPYLLSWLAIGVWLLRGIPAPRERYPAPDRPF